MTSTDHLIKDVQMAVEDLDVFPGKFVMALFRNDLRTAVQTAHQEGVNLVDIDAALRFIGSHVTGNQIKAVIRRWRKI